MSAPRLAPAETQTFAADFKHALRVVAGSADKRDRDPRFPEEGFAALVAVGVPQLAGERERCHLRAEIELVRAVAGVDASCARILNGHFNGVERLTLSASRDLLGDELEGVRTGALLLGVSGADPAPGEGSPAPGYRLDRFDGDGR